MRPRPQTKRLLDALELAGSRGVRATDLLAARIDDGPPITRGAARVADLRSAGHQIRTVREPNGTARYILEGEPERRPNEAAELVAALALPLDVRPPAQGSAFDPWDAA